MTFYARKHPAQAGSIQVGVTYGPVAFTVDEHPGHLRHFWHQLGELLNAVEAESQEQFRQRLGDTVRSLPQESFTAEAERRTAEDLRRPHAAPQENGGLR